MSKTTTVIAGLLVGYMLVRLVFVVLAVVAALPGLASLIRGIKAAGLSLQVFTVLTHYTLMFLTAFFAVDTDAKGRSPAPRAPPRWRRSLSR